MNDGGTVLEAVGSVLLCQTRLVSIQFARDIESPHVSKSLDPAVGYLGLVNLFTQGYTGDLQFSGYVENTVVKTDVLLVFVAMGAAHQLKEEMKLCRIASGALALCLCKG